MTTTSSTEEPPESSSAPAQKPVAVDADAPSQAEKAPPTAAETTQKPARKPPANKRAAPKPTSDKSTTDEVQPKQPPANKRAAPKPTSGGATTDEVQPKKPPANKRAAPKPTSDKSTTDEVQPKKPPANKRAAPKPTSDKSTTDDAPTGGATTDGAEPKKRKRKPAAPKRQPFEIAGNEVKPGKRMRMELPIGNLMSGTPVALPLIVVHGKKDGPVVWISAAIHGDEICGVEIIRQVLDAISAPSMAGTIIAAPVVNVHGFNTSDRYLPDRRDLNRSFPGSSRGSLASRIAHLFMKEIVKRSDVGIDLHTGADLRTNLPQIRCDIDHAPTVELAEVFGAPLIIDARVRDGSLRQATVEAGKIMLLYEGGEASRFDPAAIAAGTAGVLRTLNHLGLTEIETPVAQRPLYSRSTSWSRASNSGIVHLDAHLGELVSAKQQLATIYDPFGKILGKIKAKQDGIVMGHTQAPLVNRGDAISHVARILTEAPNASRIDTG